MCEAENAVTLKAYFEENYALLRGRITKKISERNPDFRNELIDEALNQTYYEIADRTKEKRNPTYKKYVGYSIKDAVRKVLFQEDIEGKNNDPLIKPKSIPNYYERVQELIKKGMHEEEAKKKVRMDWTISKKRIIGPADINKNNNPSLDERDNKGMIIDWFERLHDKHKSSTEVDEQDLIDAYNHCADKYKNNTCSDNSKRDYRIFIEVYFNGMSGRNAAEKINVKPGRVTQIWQGVYNALKDCILDVLIGQGHYELL